MSLLCNVAFLNIVLITAAPEINCSVMCTAVLSECKTTQNKRFVDDFIEAAYIQHPRIN